MKFRNKFVLPVISMLLMVLTACNLPSREPVQATTSSEPPFLQTAQAAAAATLTSRAVMTPIRTGIPAGVETLTPTASASPQTKTVTGNPMVSVSKETNCRLGPDTAYDRVGGLLVGVKAEVFGIDASRNYYYIRNPDDPQGFCWIWGSFATTEGDISALPVFTPMPYPTVTMGPTPVPNFVVAIAKLDVCVGWFVEVKVSNTGNATWASGSVIARDTVTTTIVSERTANQFEDWIGCTGTGHIQNDLAPGESGSLHSFDFLYNPSGNAIVLTIRLCTLDGMAGNCMTQEVTFTP
jgi:uncharacterized protein YraI